MSGSLPRFTRRRIRRLIFHFEIDDTATNRERATSKMFEGRAAALLDIDERHELIDKSQSEFTGGGRAFAPAAVVSVADTAAQGPAPTASLHERPLPTAPIAIPEEPEITQLDLTPRPAVTKKATPKTSEAGQRVVAIADFEKECEKLIANMGDEWEPATARDAMALVRMFKSVLIEHGVEHIPIVSQRVL